MPTAACRSLPAAFGGPLHAAPTRRRPVALRVFDALLRWQDRACQRHLLAGLDDHLLKDIGLSRADAAQEYAKPFWRE